MTGKTSDPFYLLPSGTSSASVTKGAEARKMTQHGSPPGWLEVSDPAR